MDYYDGNTVTALWNYAQHYAMSNNSFGTTFGPSTPGALNLDLWRQTHGAHAQRDSVRCRQRRSNGTMIGDPDPAFDACSSSGTRVNDGTNIGDLLTTRRASPGAGSRAASAPASMPTARPSATAATQNIGGANEPRITSPHHEPFQYYASTANPHHLPPTSVGDDRHTDRPTTSTTSRDFCGRR